MQVLHDAGRNSVRPFTVKPSQVPAVPPPVEQTEVKLHLRFVTAGWLHVDGGPGRIDGRDPDDKPIPARGISGLGRHRDDRGPLRSRRRTRSQGSRRTHKGGQERRHENPDARDHRMAVGVADHAIMGRACPTMRTSRPRSWCRQVRHPARTSRRANHRCRSDLCNPRRHRRGSMRACSTSAHLHSRR